MISRIFIFIIIALSFSSLYAVSSKIVTFDSKTDFERGTAKNVTILFDGTLTPAPDKVRLLDTGEPFIWAIAEDSKGNVYLGTGNDGKLFKVTPKGDSLLVLDAEELGIFALAVDSKDNVYAATSPNGHVYKISAAGSSTFFDPDAVYIWDLQVDSQGNLLVATGEKAFIYRVTTKGADVLFQAEENHVRSMALLADGTIYAGTSANGFVYRIKPNEKPFVLFDPQMQEVNRIVIGDNGDIFASAFGQSIAPIVPRTTQQQNQSQERNGSNGGNDDNESSLAPQTLDVESLMKSRSAPTSLFRITPDGYAKDLWLGVDEKIQSIARYNGEKILVGSGKSGKLLTISRDGDLSVLMDNDESHITSIVVNPAGRIVFGTSNLGRGYLINEKQADSSHFTSETIDAGQTARWGTLVWRGNKAAASSRFYTRSGNTEQPSQTWSDWLPVEKDGDVSRIKSPVARFLQWRCNLENKNARIEKVTLSYIQKNIAPSISSLIIHRPGDYYEPKSNKTNDSKGITFPSPLPNKQAKKGFRTVDWLFEDPNFDGLCFDLYYRRTGTSWRELAKELAINFLSWDSAQMADGEYEIKVVASDKLTNPENMALEGEKVSTVFVIDNSGPAIQTGNKTRVKVLTVRISDEWNPLRKVEYSIDAQAWKVILPVDGILDSKTETFEIELPDTQGHDVALKASDSTDNVSVLHTSTK